MPYSTHLSSATPEYIRQVVQDGACVCWSSRILTVPIPLIDLRFQADGLFTWATIQTPFGSERPLFGVVQYAEERHEGGGLTFWDAAGHAICAIFPNHMFGFPDYTETKLATKAQNHFSRLSDDAAYAAAWERHFSVGTAECLAAMQLESSTS